MVISYTCRPVGTWSFTAGFGYLHFEYDKYAFPRGDAPIGKFRNEYWGLTKAGISIVYIIK